jgi:hypothetical protein
VNSALENLALRKQVLLARSTLCRLRIRHELNGVQETLRRPAQLAAKVARALFFAKLAGTTLRLLRKLVP